MNRYFLSNCITSALLILFMFFFSSCATSVRPYTSAENVQQTSRTDIRLWALADEFDEDVSHTSGLYSDVDLQSYLQNILDRLYPDFQGKIRIQVLRSPSLNAFALPNGSLYINTSLLARCSNEAQAATILGHEAAHFVDRHSLRQTEQIQNITTFANVLNIAGVPLVGPLLAVSSTLGYSKELESKADRIAYERMLLAGYDTRESVKIFERMAAETKNMGTEEPYFFSTHPRMVERVESLNEMLQDMPPFDSEVNSEVFLLKTKEVRIVSLEEDISMNRYKSVIMLLENADISSSGYPEFCKYYLGEAYRQRGDIGDNDRAFLAYQEALSAAPEFAPTYRALGLYYLKQKDLENARFFLEGYLLRDPDAIDKNYIHYYIESLEKEEGS